MSEIKTLTDQVLRFREARNWAQFHTPKDVALSLIIEAAELAEHFQWKNLEEQQNCSAEQRAKIGEELADVLYWVLLLSHDLGIDLVKAFENKLLLNEQKYPIEKARDRHTKYTEL